MSGAVQQTKCCRSSKLCFKYDELAVIKLRFYGSCFKAAQETPDIVSAGVLDLTRGCLKWEPGA